MDLASVVAALASVGVRVSGSAPNSSVQVDSSRACPPGLAGPEPSGTINNLGQHFHAAQELLAFITPKARVFKWKVMPFGVANAPALFQEVMNKILYILRRRPLVQELISRGAEMEAHIDDVSLGTNTQEDHVFLLREFFIVCQENHL